MTYRGHMQNGVAILDAPTNLPDGTPVRVEVETRQSAFWQNKTIDELARDQGVAPLHDPWELAGDWPAEDSVDELLDLLRKARS